MPKKIHKIDKFHGGLNNNADPRDIAEEELSAATDVMVDELGKIRTLGGTADHDAGSSTAVDIEAGYGLFQFSHDRINGHVGEHLANTDDFSSNWARTDDMAVDATDATYTHSSGAGTLIQTAANRLEKGVANVTYAFTYTISGFAETITLFEISGGGSQFAAATTALEQSDGTHTTTFTSHATDPDQPFTINVTSDSSGTFSIDNMSLVIYSAAETGDNYLAIADNESSDPAIYIYSANQDSWSNTQIVTLGATNNFAPCFYYVDGALRVSDGNFGKTNTNKWHGYVKNTWFPDIGSGYAIDQWYQTEQRPLPPGTSYFQKDWTKTSGETTTTVTIPTGAVSVGGQVGTHQEVTKETINNAFAADDDQTRAVVRCVVQMHATTITPDNQTVSCTIKAGFWNDNGDGIAGETGGDGVWSAYAQEHEIFDEEVINDLTYTHTFNYDTTVTDTDDTNLPGGSGTDYFRVEITSFTDHSTNYQSVFQFGATVLYEGTTTTFPELDSGGSAFTNGYSTGNNVCMLWSWDAASSDGDDWVPSDNAGLWGVGATFIYDGVQESQLTELIDEADNSIDGMNLAGLSSGNLTTTDRPAIVLAIADPTHNGAGDGDGTTWNKRITGCNIYLKDLHAATEGTFENPWLLQYSADFLTGKLRVQSTQAEFNALLQSDATNQSYYYWFLDTTHSTSPSTLTSYEMNSGFDSTSEAYISAYKTAVVTNRMTYIGNIQITKSDGSSEIKGDAMAKSLVGKFDVFPASRLIEVSINDGDNIVQLHEYADRILQFKKNKMHLINISQELEFLEDTFMHKGVLHPAATCKTDFGIAWVNKLGCYLYDGKEVHNLLERKGRQIIKESEWDTFATNQPMISYIPKKRQLIVVDDITTAGTGKIFLYDMVTQSWVRGTNGTFPDQNKTNFVTDWNGDLIAAHTNGTVVKWDDTSYPSGSFDCRTKDIDFGHPGVRKKIYKIYVTYQSSNDTTNVQVDYDVDGGTTFPYDFTVPELPAANGWQVAELKPDTSSESNNIKSIRLRFATDGTVPSGFEINDISIVYRLKNIK